MTGSFGLTGFPVMRFLRISSKLSKSLSWHKRRRARRFWGTTHDLNIFLSCLGIFCLTGVICLFDYGDTVSYLKRSIYREGGNINSIQETCMRLVVKLC